MSKKTSSVSVFTPANLSRVIIAVAILGGLLLSYRTTPSQASVQPPDGNGTEEVFVDGIIGSDTTGDGSQAKPFATIGKGNSKLNISHAPLAKLWVRPMKTPYQITSNIYPKRNNTQFLSWGSGRPVVMPAKGYSGLLKFDVQKYSGILLSGFDFIDVGIMIRGGQNNVITNNRVTIDSIGKLIDYNNGAIISSYIWDDTEPEEYITENLTIDHNTLTIIPGEQDNRSLIGIRLQSVRGAKVYANTFAPLNAATVVSVFDSIDGDFGPNSYSNNSRKDSVYKFDHANDSRVYAVWPF